MQQLFMVMLLAQVSLFYSSLPVSYHLEQLVLNLILLSVDISKAIDFACYALF